MQINYSLKIGGFEKIFAGRLFWNACQPRKTMIYFRFKRFLKKMQRVAS